MSGIRKVWRRGQRTVIVGRDQRGIEVTRLGKNGGPVIEQTVDLSYVPKES